LGLDKPLISRYFDWITGVMRGDFGSSFSGRNSSGFDLSRPVLEIMAPKLKNTVFLALVTAAVAVPLALILGLLTALFRNSIFDRGANGLTLTTISAPEFFLAYILIIAFGGMLPTIANVKPDMGVLERLRLIALPTITLTLVIVAHMMRMTRAAIINLLASPYIEMARLSGASQTEIIFRHALPNAWAPIATVIAFNLAYLVVGVVVVEVVFTYEGIGKLMVDSVGSRDIPVVQACALIFAATYILLNLLADLVGILTNPRLLHPR
jgi:peptide/nickel transport system permease protein